MTTFATLVAATRKQLRTHGCTLYVRTTPAGVSVRARLHGRVFLAVAPPGPTSSLVAQWEAMQAVRFAFDLPGPPRPVHSMQTLGLDHCREHKQPHVLLGYGLGRFFGMTSDQPVEGR